MEGLSFIITTLTKSFIVSFKRWVDFENPLMISFNSGSSTVISSTKFNNPVKFDIPEDYGIGHQRADQETYHAWNNKSSGGKRTKRNKYIKKSKKSRKTK
jgi:hypothetical protein